MSIKDIMSTLPDELQDIIYTYLHQMKFCNTMKTIKQGGISNIEDMPDLVRDHPIIYRLNYPIDDPLGWSVRVSEFLHKVSF